MKLEIQSITVITKYELSYEMVRKIRELIEIFKNQVSIESRPVNSQKGEILVEIEIKSYFGSRFKRSKEEFDLYLNEIINL